jgi:DNA invertase Pin-like site-specific DNA recombinase
MRAAIYARLSLAGDVGEETGIDRQLLDCERTASSLGAVNTEKYVDDGVSAYNKRTRRPEFERLLGDIEAGRVDTVIAWRADRLARRNWDAARLLKAIEDAPHPIKVIGVADGTDTSGPMGAMFFNFLVLQGNSESAAIATRVRRSHEARAQRGKFGGGPRAFGHNADRTALEPIEAAAIQDAAARILDGESINSILRDWKTRGIRTPRGNDWQHTALVKLLQQPRMAGLRVLRGVEGSGSIPPILDRETWDRLCSLLADPSRRPALPGGQPRHLLSGLMTCSECGVTMGAKGNGGKKNGANYWTYGCIGTRPGACGRVWVKGEPTDEYVAGLVKEALRSPALAQLVAGDPSADGREAELRRDYVAKKEQLTAIESEWLIARTDRTRTVSDAAYQRAVETIRTEVEALERRLTSVERNRVLANVLDDPDGLWESASLEDRRTLVRLVFPVIKVERASRRRWHPERIRLVPAA